VADDETAPDVTPPASTGALPLPRLIVSVVGIGLTQIIGWGTSFSAIAVLGTRIGSDLAISRELVFGGISIMLIVSALASPEIGRRLDRHGPRVLMMFGALVGAVALTMMAAARGPLTFWLGWAMFGLAVPLSLSNTAVPAIVHIAGPHARRAVTGLTIIAGVTSALFLPLTAYIEARVGWRLTFLLFAAAHLLICLPIYALLLPSGRLGRAASSGSSDAPWDGVLAPERRRRAFALLATWSCLEGTLVWGFNMQAIDILRSLGFGPAAAIAIWMLSGPSQSTARIADFLASGRYSVISMAIVSAALAPLGFAAFLLGGMSVGAASVLAVCYGLGHGLFAIARNLLPLRLFGLKEFAVTMGRLALPQNLANGLAPILFAALIGRVGGEAAIWVSVACAGASLASVVLLAREIRTPVRNG
jgi:predicted MFS family arabinose efflux permease